MAYIKALFSFILAFIQILIPIASVGLSGSDAYFTKWDESTVYTEDYAVKLERIPAKTLLSSTSPIFSFLSAKNTVTPESLQRQRLTSLLKKPIPISSPLPATMPGRSTPITI